MNPPMQSPYGAMHHPATAPEDIGSKTGVRFQHVEGGFVRLNVFVSWERLPTMMRFSPISPAGAHPEASIALYRPQSSR